MSDDQQPVRLALDPDQLRLFQTAARSTVLAMEADALAVKHRLTRHWAVYKLKKQLGRKVSTQALSDALLTALVDNFGVSRDALDGVGLAMDSVRRMVEHPPADED